MVMYRFDPAGSGKRGWIRGFLGWLPLVVPLPVEVEADKVKAKFKRGVLQIRLPKSEQAREDVRKIEITGED